MIKKTFVFIAFIAISMVSTAQADTAMFPLPKDYPKYPAGKEALNAFIQQNIVYPEYEKSMGIEGTVVVGCDVELDGTLSNFIIESTLAFVFDCLRSMPLPARVMEHILFTNFFN